MIQLIFGLFLLMMAHPSAEASELRLEGDFIQGGLVVGQTTPEASVHLGDKPLVVSNTGIFVFGLSRDAANTAVLSIQYPGGVEDIQRIGIAERSYELQSIDGLPANMVNPSPSELDRIRYENQLIREIRQRGSSLVSFSEGFTWPVVGIITGTYGTERMLNGELRRPHFGIDIAAPMGTTVQAAASGNVALAAVDLFYTGGTVIIEHGHGLTSVYSHMIDILVQVGDQVSQGDPIGRVGATGRATGDHLDWRVSWFLIPLDPALLAGPMPGSG